MIGWAFFFAVLLFVGGFITGFLTFALLVIQPREKGSEKHE